jgi:hypothetical protein
VPISRLKKRRGSEIEIRSERSVVGDNRHIDLQITVLDTFDAQHEFLHTC